MMIASSSKGFSLVEVLVAAGILAVLSISFLKLTKTTAKNIKTNESRNEIMNITSEIQMLLSDPVACYESLNNLNAKTQDPVDELKDDKGNIKYDLTTKRGAMKIVSMKLEDSHADIKTKIAGPMIGYTHLVMTYSKGKATFGNDLIRRIRIWVDVDAGNIIKECRLASLASSVSLWQRSTNDVNDIFYYGRHVGIGTNDPKAKLEIVQDENKNSELKVVNIHPGNDARVSVTLDNEGLDDSTAGMLLYGRNYNLNPKLVGWKDRLIINSGPVISGGVLIRPATGGFTVSTTGENNPDLTINTQGNVGIGVGESTHRLLLSGKTAVGDIDQTLGIYPGVPGASVGIQFAADKAELDKAIRSRNIAHIAIVGNSDDQFGSNVLEGDLSIGSGIGKSIHFISREDNNGTPSTAEKFSSNVTISAGGKVGIGVVNPKSKLEVNGTIKVGDLSDPTKCRKGEFWFDDSTSTPMFCETDGVAKALGAAPKVVFKQGPINTTCDVAGGATAAMSTLSMTCCPAGYLAIAGGYGMVGGPSTCGICATKNQNVRVLISNQPAMKVDGTSCWAIRTHCHYHRPKVTCLKI